jgi:hypothetical protein
MAAVMDLSAIDRTGNGGKAMNVGMLWFDNDIKAELAAKVERAASYYRKKYGIAPTVCFVHPSMLANGNTTPPLVAPVAENQETKVIQAAGVEIHSNRSVLPNHLWIGVVRELKTQATGS